MEQRVTTTQKPETKVVTLKEYNELKDDQLFLRALEDAGVDNWAGYEFAQEQYYEWQDNG